MTGDAHWLVVREIRGEGQAGPVIPAFVGTTMVVGPLPSGPSAFDTRVIGWAAELTPQSFVHDVVVLLFLRETSECQRCCCTAGGSPPLVMSAAQPSATPPDRPGARGDGAGIIRTSGFDFSGSGMSVLEEPPQMPVAESATLMLAVAPFNRARPPAFSPDDQGHADVASVAPSHVVRLAPAASCRLSVASLYRASRLGRDVTGPRLH
jgi:hypothetical protein